jgi:hypothetical protein
VAGKEVRERHWWEGYCDWAVLHVFSGSLIGCSHVCIVSVFLSIPAIATARFSTKAPKTYVGEKTSTVRQARLRESSGFFEHI